MRQDGHDHLAVRDVGHNRPPATAMARQNVHQISGWPSERRPPRPPIASENPLFSSVNLERASLLSPPRRSGDDASPLATNADASSGFFIVRFFFLARGTVGVAPPLATGPRGTTAARSGDRGPNTPDKRCNGNRGGGIKLARRDKNCTGVITRCVAPLRLGLRRRYATRPSARIDKRSKLNGGRAP